MNQNPHDSHAPASRPGQAGSVFRHDPILVFTLEAIKPFSGKGR